MDGQPGVYVKSWGGGSVEATGSGLDSPRRWEELTHLLKPSTWELPWECQMTNWTRRSPGRSHLPGPVTFLWRGGHPVTGKKGDCF